MVPFFDDAAVVDDDDVVGIADRAQAMGDDDSRAAFHEAVQRGLDDFFAFRIEGRRRFIEDEDARVLKDSPGNGNALALATGQGAAAIADEGFVTARQFPNEIMGIGRLGGSDDFFVCRCRR